MEVCTTPSNRSYLALRHNDKIKGPSTSHHWTTPFYNCHAFPCTRYVDIQRWSHVLLPVALSVFATFGCLNCIFGKLWCSNAAYIHNEFHRRTSFPHPFCLELLFVAPIILWAGSLIFYLLVSLFCAYKLLSLHNLKTMLQIGSYPWSLSLPTIRAAFRVFYWTQHDNSCSQRCLRVHSDNKSTAEPDKRI